VNKSKYMLTELGHKIIRQSFSTGDATWKQNMKIVTTLGFVRYPVSGFLCTFYTSKPLKQHFKLIILKYSVSVL